MDSEFQKELSEEILNDRIKNPCEVANNETIFGKLEVPLSVNRANNLKRKIPVVVPRLWRSLEVSN